MTQRLFPSTEASLRRKNIIAAHTRIMVGTEIERMSGRMVERGDFISFGIDDGTGIGRLTEPSIGILHGIPNVQAAPTSGPVRDKIKHISSINLTHKRMRADRLRKIHRLIQTPGLLPFPLFFF